jgi:hypothetical protein
MAVICQSMMPPLSPRLSVMLWLLGVIAIVRGRNVCHRQDPAKVS